MNACSGSRQVAVAVVRRLGAVLAARLRTLAAGARAIFGLGASAKGVFGPGGGAAARAAGSGGVPSAVPGARLGRMNGRRQAAGNGTRARYARLVRQPETVRIGRVTPLRIH
ncbi:hypothetical protein ACIQ9E_09015 [Streptomyces sp. NPDC094448]|uniref:hypothetical protein n=1 Tax=Streptomyces sp. NPDC094448 TaxID=3366063 RepID=UPI00381971CE